jgi:molecular chaperone GrpE
VTNNTEEEIREDSIEAENSVPDSETEQSPADGEIQVEEDSSNEAAPSELDAIKEEMEALKAENNELKDQYLRKHADFENYRKRMTREKADSVKYGNQELLKDLIEVIDNFDRAIKSAADSQDFNAFREGISMIEQQFTGMLQSKWGLEKMDCQGAEYDPNSHEALMMEDNEEIEVPTVLEDFQAGYRLHERVLRPAKVKVGKPAVNTAASDKTIEDN